MGQGLDEARRARCLRGAFVPFGAFLFGVVWACVGVGRQEEEEEEGKAPLALRLLEQKDTTGETATQLG